MKLKLSEIKSNPKNPRFIKDNSFKKLVQSLKDLPVMTELREVILDQDGVIIGGNMRYKAAKEAGWNEISVKYFKPEDAERNNKLAKELNPDFIEKTYEEYVDEITIKDNVSGGEWDWDMLANEWNTDLLDQWGLESSHFKVNDVNELDEWVGMPEFESRDDILKIVIQFQTEEDRDKYIEETGLKISTKAKMTWSTWYPYKEYDNLVSKKYE